MYTARTQLATVRTSLPFCFQISPSFKCGMFWDPGILPWCPHLAVSVLEGLTQSRFRPRGEVTPPNWSSCYFALENVSKFHSFPHGPLLYQKVLLNRLYWKGVLKPHSVNCSDSSVFSSPARWCIIFTHSFISVAFSGSGWRRQWHPIPVLLPGKSHGRRSLVGHSPWGR